MLRIASLVALVVVASSSPCRRPCQMDQPRPCLPPTTQAPCPMMDSTTQMPCRMMDSQSTPTPCRPTQPPCMMDYPTTPLPCLPTTTTEAPCMRDPPTTPSPCLPTTTTEAPCRMMDAPTTAAPCPTQPPCLMDVPSTQAPCLPTTTTQLPCMMDLPSTPSPCMPTTTTQPPCMMDVATPSPCNPLPPCYQDVPATPCPYGYDAAPAQPQHPEFNECEDGWTRYQESCYYVERQETATLDQAEKQCLQKDATLFVADSMEEFETIIDRAPQNTWTWLGLVKASEDDLPRWHTNASISYKDLPWLIKPYGDSSNGWTQYSKCAAHWNPSSTVGKYNYYYPCTYSYYFVCEKNSTLIEAANTLKI